MAPAALILWPLISLGFFAALGGPRGLIWSVVIGYLFLPENFFAVNLPLADYDKPFAISFAAALGAVLFREKPGPDLKVVRTPLPACMFMLLAMFLFVTPIGTFLTNPETLVNGPTIRPGLSPRDALADMVKAGIAIVPLVLAWWMLRRPEHHRELLMAILMMGLVYTFFTLFERRMAPQLNMWVYGYFPHAWLQHIRGGGYRPLVFLRHGLWLGFFLFTVLLAAIALSRDPEVRSRALMPFAAMWVMLVLLLSRNLGASMLALVFAPLLALTTFKLQGRIASVLAIVILTYPALHEAMEQPMDRFLDFVSDLSAERAQSFETRLNNETQLLDRANEKPIFGWGGWGRMRIVDETGRDVSLVDGAWIVFKGNSGWVGYLAYFGLLTFPVFFAARAARRKKITPAIGAMMAMMAGNYLYIIPNSTINPIAYLMLGAMAAFAHYDPVQVAETEERPEKPDRTTRYSRFAPGGSLARESAEAQGSSPHRRAVSTPYSSRSRRKSGA